MGVTIFYKLRREISSNRFSDFGFFRQKSDCNSRAGGRCWGGDRFAFCVFELCIKWFLFSVSKQKNDHVNDSVASDYIGISKRRHTHACMHACIHTYTYVYARTHAPTYTFTNTYTYTRAPAQAIKGQPISVCIDSKNVANGSPRLGTFCCRIGSSGQSEGKMAVVSQRVFW